MSKLGPHFIGSPGLERWIAAGPAIYKFDPTGLGASSAVPPGPLVIGKLDQEDPALGLTDWKALKNRGMTPEAAADIRFYAQTDIYAGANRPRVNRYEANPRIDVWEDDNEVVPDNEVEAAWYAQYCIEMMMLYEGIGKRRANFSFAVGTPDVDIWKHLLSAVRHARDNGHYIALHEYMGYEPDYGVGWKQVDGQRNPTTNVWHGRSDKSYPWGWAALRYRYIWDTVLSPAGLGNVRLLITELGCDSVESVTPIGKPVGTWKEHAPHWTAEGKDAEAHYAEMLAWYDQRMLEDAYVAGGVVFTVGSVGIWRNWDIAGTKTEALLVDYISRQPNDPPRPPVVQPPAGVNLLANPSFENGWQDSDDYSTTQNPTGWTVAWNIGSSFENPHSEFHYLLGEAVHKNKAMLPEHERDVFIWDGDWGFKLFAGQRAFWARLKQTLDLPAAKYRLSTPVWVDAYHMTPGPKNYNVDANQAEVMVKCNGVVVRDWTALPSGGRRETVTEWQHAGGTCELAIHLRMNWPINNNFFLDGWSLEAVPVTPPPPPPPPPDPEPERHRAIVLKLPQDVAAAEWQTAAAYGYQYRHTMTASHDDMLTILRGGNEQSYVKLAWPSRQPDVAQLVEAAGYEWTAVLDDDPAPSAPFEFTFYPVSGGTRRVTQAFGARPEVYAQYGFPGHEGIDLAATMDAPVLAVAPGKVGRVTDTGNYGNRLDIQHDSGWVTTYAHLNRFADLRVGDAVVAGQVIGYAGTTGNSTGVHLHMGLKRPGSTFTDSRGTVWPFNIFDPTPYLERYLAQPDSRIDLLPFLQGQHRRQFDMGHDAGTQTVQVWHLGPKDWLYVKGENGEYERLGLRTWNGREWIFRFEDTSESAERFYAHYLNEGGPIGAPWLPRMVEVGRWYETSKFVQHYLKAGCVKQNGGPATDKLRVMSYPRVVNYASAQSLARLDEVITVEWSAGEQYDFASGRGCVAFRDANRTFWFIGDLQGRADKTFKKPGCIALGW